MPQHSIAPFVVLVQSFHLKELLKLAALFNGDNLLVYRVL